MSYPEQIAFILKKVFDAVKEICDLAGLKMVVPWQLDF